jgi:hypothetical protein
LPLHRLHEDFASRRASRKGNFWMTLFIKLATSAIKKSPLCPPLSKWETAQQGNSLSLKKGVREDFGQE